MACKMSGSVPPEKLYTDENILWYHGKLSREVAENLLKEGKSLPGMIVRFPG